TAEKTMPETMAMKDIKAVPYAAFRVFRPVPTSITRTSAKQFEIVLPTGPEISKAASRDNPTRIAE
ncbi:MULTISPECIES: hypothetical protein, partial [Pseudomonas aeruginosa group]|uniref:hypothetical protein n=1 Tax=Pseudomonas aeruginosa group TaxID=136841 RepID=UPI001C8C77AE